MYGVLRHHLVFTPGPSSHPNGLDITIKVKEKRMLSGNAGTQVGNNEGSMVR